ncbi:MAG TPA: hypothetical protein VEO95_05565 [Chthoniobacteraceae bacterium]|nr:hypothetical protein [Chthoniobacteraceae bacterium]
MPKREKLDPSWHKARIAARIWLKAQQGQPLSPRDKRLARRFAEDKAVENRLIQQGVLGRLGGPYRIVETRSGPKRLLSVLGDPDELGYVLGRTD